MSPLLISTRHRVCRRLGALGVSPGHRICCTHMHSFVGALRVSPGHRICCTHMHSFVGALGVSPSLSICCTHMHSLRVFSLSESTSYSCAPHSSQNDRCSHCSASCAGIGLSTDCRRRCHAACERGCVALLRTSREHMCRLISELTSRTAACICRRLNLVCTMPSAYAAWGSHPTGLRCPDAKHEGSLPLCFS